MGLRGIIAKLWVRRVRIYAAASSTEGTDASRTNDGLLVDTVTPESRSVRQREGRSDRVQREGGSEKEKERCTRCPTTYIVAQWLNLIKQYYTALHAAARSYQTICFREGRKCHLHGSDLRRMNASDKLATSSSWLCTISSCYNYKESLYIFLVDDRYVAAAALNRSELAEHYFVM